MTFRTTDDRDRDTDRREDLTTADGGRSWTAPAAATEAEADAAADADADRLITADREETKYLVSPDRVTAVMAGLSASLPAHHFKGHVAGAPPKAAHFVTTFYFDTPSRHHYQAATRQPNDHVKVRAKEYYDADDTMAAAGTAAKTAPSWYDDWIWIELKRRHGTRTFKQRFRFAKANMLRVVRDGAVEVKLLVEHAQRALGGEDPQALSAVGVFADHCRSLGEPLSTTCAVSYRRHGWQDPTGRLRVTLDLGMSCFAPPTGLWNASRPLLRDTLDRPTASEGRAILEIKRRVPLPAWLETLLAENALAPVRFSKFLVAAAAAG